MTEFRERAIAAGANLPSGTITVPAAAAAAAFLFAYGGTLAALFLQWASNDMYTHGFLVPWVSLYLAWSARERLRRLDGRPSYPVGGALIAAGLFMLAVGSAGLVMILQSASLPLSLAGLVALLFGTGVLRALLPAISYLYFMVPFWNLLTDPLIPFAQRLSAHIAESALVLAGVPVYRAGLFLELPNVTLEIAPQCSGVHYIIAITALGVPLSFLYLTSWRRRLALIAAAVVIAALFNGVRIGLIGLLSYRGISSVLHGPGHVLQALSVAVIGYVVLFAGLFMLAEKRPPAEVSDSGRTPAAEGNFRQASGSTGRFYAVAALFGAVGVCFAALSSSAPPPAQSFETFPTRIGAWAEAAGEARFAGGGYLEPDHLLSRVYASEANGQVELYVGYFSRQEQERKLVNYRIAALEQRAKIVPLDLGAQGAMKVRGIVETGQGEDRLVLFWYRIDDRALADGRRAALQTALNGFVRGRRNGSLIAVSQVLPRGGEAQAAENCRLFLLSALPVIDRFLPAGRGRGVESFSR